MSISDSAETNEIHLVGNKFQKSVIIKKFKMRLQTKNNMNLRFENRGQNRGLMNGDKEVKKN